MSSDTLTQFRKKNEALLQERDELRQRLAVITAALGNAGTLASPKRGRPAKVKSTRAANLAPVDPLILLVLEATKRTPLASDEILARVQAAGHKFDSKKPLKDLEKILASSADVKDYGGKYGPVFRR